MCGIVGLFGINRSAPHRDLWQDLTNHLAHRGPDEGAFWAEGPFFLGHRRLNILDLSRGSQPMASIDGRFVVSFNGEIYNYLELKVELEAKGHRFRTQSDTEVLLAGYREWGEKLPERLTGMFAFAIADRIDESVFLARDRFGEKPLFYLETPTYLAFASEVRVLAALPDLRRQMNPQALGGFLCLNYVPGEHSLLQGVHRLPPGSSLFFKGSAKKSRIYWMPPEACDTHSRISENDLLAQLDKRLERAVNLNLRSDVPVGIFLSGGVDSSLIAEKALKQGSLSRAYCLDFNEASYSEFAFAERVAKTLGIPLDRVELTSDALTNFISMVEHADDPLADTSALAVYAISQHAAKRGSKVVLGGDGGDELFGGYLTYQASLIHQKISGVLPGFLRKWGSQSAHLIPVTDKKVSSSYKLWRFLRALNLSTTEAHHTWNGAWLPDEAASLLSDKEAATLAAGALKKMASKQASHKKLSLFDFQRCDIREYLVNDILTKTDRMSMAHGLEIRAPFLEHSFAEWALCRSTFEKLGPKKERKWLLRQKARQIFGNVIADRPKQGFSIPVHAWTRTAMRPLLEDLLSESSLKALGVFDVNAVRKKFADHLSGRRSYGYEIWGLAVLSAWHRKRIQNAPAAPAAHALVGKTFPLEKGVRV